LFLVVVMTTLSYTFSPNLFSAESEPATADADAGEGTTLAPREGAPEEASSIAGAMEYLKTKFEAGGPTMWFILFLSVLGLAFLLERAFRLRRRAFAPHRLAKEADKLWKEDKFGDIEKLCGRYRRSTLSKIILFVLRKKNAPVDLVNEAIGDIAGRDLVIHQMLTYPMLAVATLSPLLGLFGTVLGMMESFETVAVAGSMGDPTLLASGISKALVTTAFGLFVAIPSLFCYHLFRLRTRFLNRILEEEASLLVNNWLVKE
jgi:biopolymer transport protein ExbB